MTCLFKLVWVLFAPKPQFIIIMSHKIVTNEQYCYWLHKRGWTRSRQNGSSLICIIEQAIESADSGTSKKRINNVTWNKEYFSLGRPITKAWLYLRHEAAPSSEHCTVSRRALFHKISTAWSLWDQNIPIYNMLRVIKKVEKQYWTLWFVLIGLIVM